MVASQVGRLRVHSDVCGGGALIVFPRPLRVEGKEWERDVRGHVT